MEWIEEQEDEPKLEVLAPLEGELCLGLAAYALQPQDNLLCGLGCREGFVRTGVS